jgi:hypothetical protein
MFTIDLLYISDLILKLYYFIHFVTRIISLTMNTGTWSSKINGEVRVIVFNTSFNNFSVILWLKVLLVEEAGENHRPTKMYHVSLTNLIVYRIHLDVTEHYTWRQIKVTTLIAVLHFTFTVGSSTMSIVHTLK